MTPLETAPKTLDSALRECDAHLARIGRVMKLLEDFFPLTRARLESADDDHIGHIDQFIYRVSKLQDSMGTRMLPALYSLLEETDSPIPFLDILHRLEQLGVLPSVQDWQFFRNLRNHLAHEYPESIDQTVMTLNTLYAEWPRMERLYAAVREYALRHRS